MESSIRPPAPIIFRYTPLNFCLPAFFQTVLCVWDPNRYITCPEYKGKERKRGVIVEELRGRERWRNLQHGAAYTGYYEIPDLHEWQGDYHPWADQFYLLYFGRDNHDILPNNFLADGRVFIAKAHYQPDGFDWLVIPNSGLRKYVPVGLEAPSRWTPLNFDPDDR